MVMETSNYGSFMQETDFIDEELPVISKIAISNGMEFIKKSLRVPPSIHRNLSTLRRLYQYA
jgi:site-specific recombinase XerD